MLDKKEFVIYNKNKFVILGEKAMLEQGNIMRGKLNLKNREERKNWLVHLLDDKTILPWVDLSSIGCKLYRYDFENGASLILAVYSSSERHHCYGYDIIENGKAWFMNGYSECQVVDWMTSHAKEI